MGFDCRVRYIEMSAESIPADGRAALERKADELRGWDGFRFVDLMDRIEDLQRDFPAAKVALYVTGDDGYEQVWLIEGGAARELGLGEPEAKAFVARGQRKKFRTEPFHQPPASVVEAALLRELDAGDTPSYRKVGIYEELRDVESPAVEDRLVQATREVDASLWVDVRYVLGGRPSILPRLARELSAAWPGGESDPFVARLIDVLESRSAAELGDVVESLPSDLRKRLRLR